MTGKLIQIKVAGLATAIAAIIAFSGCSKEKIETPETLLTAHSWQVADVFAYDSIPDSRSIVSLCNLDNVLTFRPDHTMQFDFGVLKCDSTEHRLVDDTWSISEDKKYLTFSYYKYELSYINRQYLRILLKNYAIPGTTDSTNIYFMFNPH